MTVALALITRDEENTLPVAIGSARGLVDAVYVVDTGSEDDTVEVARSLGAVVEHRDWETSAKARTEVMKLVQGHDWILMMDADMTLEAHPQFKTWLETAPPEERDPTVDAWAITIEDRGWQWRLPWLLKGDREWVFDGPTHPFLVGGIRRSARGLTLHHHGSPKPGKFERDLVVLADGVAAGDTRSIYYTGWALRALGRTEEAIEMFERRADMGGWQEEAWHASYMAAWLREDVKALLVSWQRRPDRHEPLSRAAAIVKARGTTDQLFLEM